MFPVSVRADLRRRLPGPVCVQVPSWHPCSCSCASCMRARARESSEMPPLAWRWTMASFEMAPSFSWVPGRFEILTKTQKERDNVSIREERYRWGRGAGMDRTNGRWGWKEDHKDWTVQMHPWRSWCMRVAVQERTDGNGKDVSRGIARRIRACMHHEFDAGSCVSRAKCDVPPRLETRIRVDGTAVGPIHQPRTATISTACRSYPLASRTHASPFVQLGTCMRFTSTGGILLPFPPVRPCPFEFPGLVPLLLPRPNSPFPLFSSYFCCWGLQGNRSFNSHLFPSSTVSEARRRAHVRRWNRTCCVASLRFVAT